MSLLVFVASGLTASAVAGQACVSGAALPGQFDLGVSAGIQGEATQFGLGAGYNLRGPLAVGVFAGVTQIDDVEDEATSFGASLGYEIAPGGPLSVCPGIGVERLDYSTPFNGGTYEFSSVSIPVGVNVGWELGDRAGMAILPSLRVGLVHIRDSYFLTGEAEIEETANEFFAGAATTLAWPRFYFTGGLGASTVADSDIGLSLGVGITVP